MEQIGRLLRETAQFFGAVLKPAARSVRENSGLAVLSVVLAFGIWILVTEAENPTRTRVVQDDIVVEPINVPDAVAVVEPLSKVRVRVTVAEDVFDSLTAADFQATVDLDGLTVGQYELPVEVRPLTSRGNLRVEAVLPENIDVTLAQLISKEVPVVIDVQGDPVSGYTMGQPETDDDTVLVSGPQQFVDQVTQARATINVDGRTESVDQAVRLRARNSSDVLIEGVTLEPEITQVAIDITQQKFSRAVAIAPQPTGEPADGYNVVSVSVTPSVVTIRGEEASIAGTSSIPTRPIDITGADDDIVKTVSLDLPSGVEVAGGDTVVTVTIKIEPATGSFNFTVPVNANGLGANVAIQGELPTVVVTLTGPSPQLRALTPADIVAAVDLAGKGAGSYHLPVTVSPLGGSITVAKVNPSEIDVTVVNR